MKIQNVLRMQAVVIGFAGMLFLASSAPAQEITNTEWPDAPGATMSAQSAPAPATSNSSAAVINGNSANVAAAVATPIVSQESVSEWPAVETWMAACALVLLTMVALYQRIAARQIDRNPEGRVRQVNDRIAV